ncbi:MAG: TldD/PmbA family protein [Bacteroidota bacterium]
MGTDPPASEALFAERAQALQPVFAEQLMAFAQRGAHYADGFYEHTVLQHGRWTQRARGRLAPPDVHIRSALVEGLALQAHHAEGSWFGACAEATPEAVQRLAHQFPAPDAPTAPIYTSAPASEAAIRALLERTADVLFGLSASVVEVRLEAQSRLRHTLVVNTHGATVTRLQPLTEVRAEADVQGTQGTTSGAAQQAVMGLADAFANDVSEQVARDAIAQAARLADAKPMPSGAYAVVLAAGWGGAWLHEVIGHRLEADVASADGAASLGIQIAPAAVTLFDDGTYPGGRASTSHDDEGTPSAKTTLIHNGRCLRWLTDRAHADRLGLPRTGNGRRASYAHPPLPRMTNLYLASGIDTPDALRHAAQDGLLVHQLGQGMIDMAARTYRVYVREGRRLEHGQRTHAVRDVWLEGSIDDALHSIRGIANDGFLDVHRGRCLKHGQHLPIGCGLPTTLLSTIRVCPS